MGRAGLAGMVILPRAARPRTPSRRPHPLRRSNDSYREQPLFVLHVLFNPALMGIVALALSILWMLRDQKDRTRPLLVLALVLNLFLWGSAQPLHEPRREHIPVEVRSRPVSSRRVARPPRIRCRRRHAGPVAHSAVGRIYQAMVPMMILWLLVTQYRGWRGSVVLAYVAELIFGPLLYTIVPACGPIYTFGKRWLNPAKRFG